MIDSNYTIRRGRREDAPAAARLWMQSAREHSVYDSVYATAPEAENTMRRFLADLSSSSHSFLFVATRDYDDTLIGFISGELREGSPTFHSKSWASVDDVYVSPDERSSGIGRALLESVKAWAQEKEAHGVSLQVAAANSRARKFYTELGFREVSVYEVLEL